MDTTKGYRIITAQNCPQSGFWFELKKREQSLDVSVLILITTLYLLLKQWLGFSDFIYDLGVLVVQALLSLFLMPKLHEKINTEVPLIFENYLVH